MASKLQDTSMYQTRKENRGKQHHDSTKHFREHNSTNEMKSELQMPVGIEHGQKTEAHIIATTRKTNNLWSCTSTTTNCIASKATLQGIVFVK